MDPKYRDEAEIMRLLRACECTDVAANESRAVLGAAQYGPLDIDADGRDFVAEAVEELIDARFYFAAEAIRLRRFMDAHALQFAAAPNAAAGISAHLNALIAAVLTIDATIRDVSRAP